MHIGAERAEYVELLVGGGEASSLPPSHAPVASVCEDPVPAGAGQVCGSFERAVEGSGGVDPSLSFKPVAGRGKVPQVRDALLLRNGKVNVLSLLPPHRLALARALVQDPEND